MSHEEKPNIAATARNFLSHAHDDSSTPAPTPKPVLLTDWASRPGLLRSNQSTSNCIFARDVYFPVPLVSPNTDSKTGLIKIIGIMRKYPSLVPDPFILFKPAMKLINIVGLFAFYIQGVLLS